MKHHLTAPKPEKGQEFENKYFDIEIPSGRLRTSPEGI